MPRPNLVAIRKRMEEGGVLGVSIAYLDPSKKIPIVPVVIGKTDVHGGTPHILVDENTAFGAASLSKPVFSYLVLKLIADKKLRTMDGKSFDLDTPISKILPSDGIELKKFYESVFNPDNKPDRAVSDDFIQKAKQITSRMVLSHTTGIPINGAPRIDFEPGTQYAYGNMALYYLQKAIEQRTDKSLETLVKENIFTPQGMKHSSFIPPRVCRFINMSEDPTPENQKEATSPRYILTETGFFYYDNAKGEVLKIELGQENLMKLQVKFKEGRINNLTEYQLNFIATITGHKTKEQHPVAANSLHTTASDYARFVAAWMNEKDCGLINMSETPTVANQIDALTSRYILTETGFYYYNKNKNEVITITSDMAVIAKLQAHFSQAIKENGQVDVLSIAQLKAITGITGHTNPLQEAFRPAISLMEDQWAIDRKVPDEDLQHLAWGLGLGLQLDNKGEVTTAFHTGDMNQWRGWVAMDVKAKSAVVYFANGDETLNRSGMGYGHVLAELVVVPEAKMQQALNWFFPKFGFSRNVEPGWKEREKADSAAIDSYVKTCLVLPPKPLKETKEYSSLEDARVIMQHYRGELGDAKRSESGPIAAVERDEVKEEQKAPPF